VVDVRHEEAVRNALGEVVERFGRIDGVVHSAAIAQHGETAAELPAETFREILDVNVTGSFLVARAAAELMAYGGSIVLLSSPSAFRARPGMTAYSASKAGVIALTQSLAVEFAPLGIRVNCVSPGVTLTPLMLDSWGARDADEAFRMADAQAHIPLGRLVMPEEVAATVAYLTSAGSAAMTGHNLVVDGGRSL
jgi:NAD(P)-dependent dehydrogenase (short-subunit alcohol dehydrogenase family)